MNLITYLGFFIVVLGLLLHFGVEIPGLQWVGRLPGDLIIKKGNVSIYFPFSTSILISLGISCVAHLFRGK